MVSNKKYQLVLASQSPRRKELLGWIDVPFIIFKSEIEEHSESHDPVTFAEEIASSKKMIKNILVFSYASCFKNSFFYSVIFFNI